MRSQPVAVLTACLLGVACADPMSGVRFACDEPGGQSTCATGWVCVAVAGEAPYAGVCAPAGAAGDDGVPEGLDARQLPEGGPDLQPDAGCDPGISDGVAESSDDDGDADSPGWDAPGADAVGSLAKVVTVLDAGSIVAGKATGGRCRGFDAGSVELQGVPFVVDAPADLSVVAADPEFQVTGQKAGVYALRCKPADGRTVELVGASLTVESGPAATLTLRLVPASEAFHVGDVAKIGFERSDAFGNAVAGGVLAKIAVDPVDGVDWHGADEFTFLSEGRYVFSACDSANLTLCGEVVAFCDSTPPAVVIDYPERAATLAGDPRVVVTGHSFDSTCPPVSLVINGDPVPVGGDGAFLFPLDVIQGMNLIETVACDACGNQARSLRSFLFSSVWYPVGASTPLAWAVPKGIQIHLGDRLFSMQEPAGDNTLSAWLASIVANVDWLSVFPSPLTTFSQLDCVYDLSLTAIEFGTPGATIRPAAGGLGVNVRLEDMEASFLLKKSAGSFICPGDTQGTASATAFTSDSAIAIDVDPETHRFRGQAGVPQTALVGFELSMDAWFNSFADVVTNGIANALTDEIGRLVTDPANRLPETLNGLVAAPLDRQMPAWLPGMSPVPFQVTLQPEALTLGPSNGTLIFNAAASAARLVDRETLGSLGRAACLTGTPEVFEFPPSSTNALEVAGSEDLVNEVLFATWYARGLHLHLRGEDLASAGVEPTELGIQDLDVVTAPLLPPVMTSCPSGKPELEFGDFYMEMSFTAMGVPVLLHLFAFIRAEAEWVAVAKPGGSGAVGLRVHKPHLVDVDVVYLNDEAWGHEEDLASLARTLLSRTVETVGGSAFEIPLPVVDTTALLYAAGMQPDPEWLLLPSTPAYDQGYLHAACGIALR